MRRLGLRLTPHGRLSAEEQDDGPEIDAAASIRLIDAFARGTGYGLVWLGAAEVGQALPPLFVWWRDFAALYVGSLLSACVRLGSGRARKTAELAGANCRGALISGVDCADYAGGRVSDRRGLAGVVGGDGAS